MVIDAPPPTAPDEIGPHLTTAATPRVPVAPWERTAPETEPVETEAVSDAGGSDTTTIAWEHVYTTSPPELRRWLDNSKPVAMHQDALMVAVPNNFTRNQLEGRFRPDIEQQLSDYFQRTVQLAVIVDATVTPASATVAAVSTTTHPDSASERAATTSIIRMLKPPTANRGRMLA